MRRLLAPGKGDVWLSPISVFEFLVLAERGRVRLDADPRARVADALEKAPPEEVVPNHEVALRSREVALPHPDPADRFLVATALCYELTLVTADRPSSRRSRAPSCPTAGLVDLRRLHVVRCGVASHVLAYS